LVPLPALRFLHSFFGKIYITLKLNIIGENKSNYSLILKNVKSIHHPATSLGGNSRILTTNPLSPPRPAVARQKRKRKSVAALMKLNAVST